MRETGRQRMILGREDDPDDRTSACPTSFALTMILRSYGYAVLEADNRNEARRDLSKELGAVNVRHQARTL